MMDQPLIYWIVGASMAPHDDTAMRHAIRKHPGAFPAMTMVPALCEQQVKIPTSTPYGDVPRTTSVRACCRTCQQIADEDGSAQRKWDF